ncbi:MAG: hypothetical protein AABW89_02675 [Nanoarchaeota archaeon]
MVSRKIIKYVVAFQRNSEFGRALGYGQGSGPTYQMELAFDYREDAARKAGLNSLITGIIFGGPMENLSQERQNRRTTRGIADLTPTQQARVARIKETQRKLGLRR